MYAIEVVYTRLLTALAASNNKPATCVIHYHLVCTIYPRRVFVQLGIPRASIYSTGRLVVPGPLAGARLPLLAVSVNTKTHKSPLPLHIFILLGSFTSINILSISSYKLPRLIKKAGASTKKVAQIHSQLSSPSWKQWNLSITSAGWSKKKSVIARRRQK